ncbi:flagellar hook protein FlgE [Ideonella azotifigens]|uniref:Flagellar hook protein FlgE n=1 Tax=Ideonella azotifigens TaxID=513160 RepID=A0ABN1K6S1_9BURK|nr:flagellar hook protein FlgE [Ideonella azotifigens]MCD2342171.1 flagellar hook protein FlgE [Ideonella azotifigens]
MSFQQGLSGLNVMSKSLDVIGNNIANANTYGAKSSRAEFADMYASALNGAGTNNVGIGVQLASVSQQFTQGNITATENPMDVAINGGGFFQLTDGHSPVTYSRNGQFKVDSTGNIVNNQGLKLMGYQADNTGTIQPGLAVPLQLPTAGISPQATTSIDMEFNLDSRLATTDPGSGVSPRINFTDATTYNKATSLTTYDAKGQPVALTYYYQKTDTDKWNVYVTANGTSVGGSSTDPQPLTELDFQSDGSSATPTGVTFDIPASQNSAGSQTLPITGIDLSFKGSTQYGSDFAVTNLAQDGYAPGSLSSIAIDDSGIIMARYSNGQSKPAGQVELATFRNMQGLQPMGGNGWQRTYASGDPVVGTPGVGNIGSLQAGALEESNVDLTGELVGMITAQRNYQANAQTIKTMDQVLQTLVNLR